MNKNEECIRKIYKHCCDLYGVDVFEKTINNIIYLCNIFFIDNLIEGIFLSGSIMRRLFNKFNYISMNTFYGSDFEHIFMIVINLSHNFICDQCCLDDSICHIININLETFIKIKLSIFFDIDFQFRMNFEDINDHIFFFDLGFDYLYLVDSCLLLV